MAAAPRSGRTDIERGPLMPVNVTSALAQAIRDNPGAILIQVQRASDQGAATTALRRARAEIAALDGGWQSAPGLHPGDRNGPTTVSAVAETPDGPMLYIDGGYTPDEVLATIPDIVARHLRDAGVGDAVISSLETTESLDKLSELPNAVVLVLFAPPLSYVAIQDGQRPTISDACLDAAVAWVAEDLDEEDRIWAQTLVTFPVTVGDARSLLAPERRRRSLRIVSGDPTRARIRAAHVSFISGHLALGSGGPAATDDELVLAMESLRSVARQLAAEVAYAYIDFHPRFYVLGTPNVAGDWYSRGGAAPEQLSRLCDEFVQDGFPCQILGAGHLARLARAGVDLRAHPDLCDGPHVLPDGRVELCIGSPSDWLVAPSDAGSPRRDPNVPRAAQSLLTPCLLSKDEATTVFRERVRRDLERAKASEQRGENYKGEGS